MKRFPGIFLFFGLIFATPLMANDNIFGVEELVFDEENVVENSDFDSVDIADVDTAIVVIERDSSSLAAHYQMFNDSLYEGVYNKIWSTSVVNPYNVNLYKMKDTVLISMEGYTHPFLGRITSRFGMRSYRYHYGTDVKLLVGDSVRSAFDGVVRISKMGSGYGYYVLVRHDNGLETVYGHLSKLLVTPDTYVKSGDVIGLGGNTGRSTGSHLHYEIRYVGNPINPENVVDFETGQPKDSTLTICAATYKYKSEILDVAYYVVRKGDTLSGIAKKRHTTVSKLCKLNKITPKTVLKIGRKLRTN